MAVEVIQRAQLDRAVGFRTLKKIQLDQRFTKAAGMSRNFSGQPPVTGGPTALPSSTIHAGPPSSSDADIGTASTSGTKKRKPPKMRLDSGGIRRTTSTPQIRNASVIDAGPLSPTSDKRRNKLGYHRTSVACGHCRRRKIRCLLAPDDPQRRCSNCIRLKRECNFFPVEHQGSQERRKSTAGNGDTSDAPGTSDHSSPRASTASNHDSMDDPIKSRQGVPAPPGHGYQTDGTYDASPLSEVPLQHSYTYPQVPKRSSWVPPDYHTHPSTVEDNTHPGYWANPSPSIPSLYPSNPGISNSPLPHPGQNNLHLGFGHPQEEQGWGPPARSASFGRIDSLPGYYQPMDSRQEHRQHSSQLHYQSALEPLGMTQATTSESIPMSHPGAPFHPSLSWNYPTTGQSTPSVTLPSQQMFQDQWYSETAPLDKVDEERTPGTLYTGPPQYFPPSTHPT